MCGMCACGSRGWVGGQGWKTQGWGSPRRGRKNKREKPWCVEAACFSLSLWVLRPPRLRPIRDRALLKGLGKAWVVMAGWLGCSHEWRGCTSCPSFPQLLSYLGAACPASSSMQALPPLPLLPPTPRTHGSSPAALSAAGAWRAADVLPPAWRHLVACAPPTHPPTHPPITSA